MKCRLYVDEVGNPDLGSSDKPDHRFLCLAGVIFDLKYVNNVLFPEIESRGGKEDRRLKDSFRRITNSGTNHLSTDQIMEKLTSKELKVKPKSANISGLQVADLIAHPARRWFFKNILDMDDNKVTFGDDIVKLLVDKKFIRYKGNILGYGAKKLP